MRTAAVDVTDLDPRRVLTALGYKPVAAPVPVIGGWDTLLWRFATADGSEHALRVFVLPAREAVAQREHLALEVCASAGLPAPRLEASGRFEGLPAFVLSWCPGTPLLSLVERRPWSLWRLGRLFGRMQAEVHRQSPPVELQAGAPDVWVSRVSEEYAHLADGIRALRPATTSLIHMDYHPLNLISDGRRITGVLDWGGAAAGDPRADLARTFITLVAAPAPPGPLRLVLGPARRLMLSAWKRGYEETAGPMPDERPFRAWAAATLLAEIELVVDRPGVWGTVRDVDALRRLIEVWANEAGVGRAGEKAGP